MIGILIGQLVLARIAAPVIMIGCGVALALSAFRGEREADVRPLFGLPVSLSLDNLAAGIGLSPLPIPAWESALAIGVVSAAMSCAGLYGAAAVRPRVERFIPARAGFVVGGYLCLLSLRMLLKGTA